MPELGTKFECVECGAKFYDLGKPDPVCPKCGINQRLRLEEEAAAAAAAATAAAAKRKEQEKEKEAEEQLDSLQTEEGEDTLEDEIDGA